MNRNNKWIFLVILLVTLSGCLTDQQKHAEVNNTINNLVDSIKRISSKYPELSGFNKNASIETMNLYYSYNFTPPKSKRAILPSDFGKKGIYISFLCKPIPKRLEDTYSMSPPTLKLPKLRLYLWAEVKATPDVTPGLVEEIETLLRLHAEKLKEIDEKLP